uniref:Death-associated protein 1 n=1 Tax=Panagrellus redivivus TaxID=6233 RepID=A0A7E4ZXA3_PANRE
MAPETSLHQSISAEPVKTVEKTQTLSVHTPKNAATTGKPEAVKPVPNSKGSVEEDDSYSNVSQLEDHGTKSKHPIISIVRGPDGNFEQRVPPTPMATGH